jgi:NAD+ diphosphatase
MADTRMIERSALTGFAGYPLDRKADWRDQGTDFAEMFADPRLMVAVVAGEIPILNRSGPALGVWHTPQAAAAMGPAQERVFLGLDGEAPRAALRLAPELAEPLKANTSLLVLDLRSIAVQGLVPPGDLACLGAGKALTDWHARHGFCARCGQGTQAKAGGWKRVCEGCSTEHFPRTDPVTIMLAVRGDKCLLARQSRFPAGMHSCLAGFLEPGETIEDAVRRETFEEAGIRVGRVRYLASQPWPFPSSLMIGCLAEALNDDIVLDQAELEAGRWFTREECIAMLEHRHPDALTAPVPVAIANTLLRAWLDGEGF